MSPSAMFNAVIAVAELDAKAQAVFLVMLADAIAARSKQPAADQLEQIGRELFHTQGGAFAAGAVKVICKAYDAETCAPKREAS